MGLLFTMILFSAVKLLVWRLGVFRIVARALDLTEDVTLCKGILELYIVATFGPVLLTEFCV